MDPPNDPPIIRAYTGGISTTTSFLHDVAVVQYPFRRGMTYVFYWAADGTLSFLTGNQIQGGLDSYGEKSVKVVNDEGIKASVSNNANNSPLTAAVTSNGKIHVFYADNKDNRFLTEIIYDPHSDTWASGRLSSLKLRVDEQSGIGASNEPILKVVLHSKAKPTKISEAWWDPSEMQWKTFTVS